MTELTRHDVIAALGPIDDLVIAEIIGSGITAAELAQARAWIANDEALVNAGHALPSGRIGRVIELLERIESQPETGASEETGAVLE
jgi:hypothetical protein